jgi:hypothetical protein
MTGDSYSPSLEVGFIRPEKITSPPFVPPLLSKERGIQGERFCSRPYGGKNQRPYGRLQLRHQTKNRSCPIYWAYFRSMNGVVGRVAKLRTTHAIVMLSGAKHLMFRFFAPPLAGLRMTERQYSTFLVSYD